jgi:mRNA interferase HigB
VNVISQATLRAFWEKHPDAKGPLKSWYLTCRKARWQNLMDVKQVYPHADLAGRCTVFNIKGNHYRLITKIEYRIQRIYVKRVLTHAEYGAGRWKDEC